MQLRYEVALRANKLTPAKEWGEWFVEKYAERMGSFATLTFSSPVTRTKAIIQGKRFGRLLNESVYGRYYRRHNKGLVTIFAVEGREGAGGRRAAHHLHYLIEKHPQVDSSRITRLWGKLAGSRASRIGVNVEPINSIREVTDYVLKNTTWEHGPELYAPYGPKARD